MGEDAAGWGEFYRRTILSDGYSTRLAALHVPIEIAGHEQGELAVIVVIKKSSRGRPSSAANSCLRGDIGKSSVAVVVIKNIFSEVRHVNIGIPVVIVVTNGDTHAIISVAGIG